MSSDRNRDRSRHGFLAVVFAGVVLALVLAACSSSSKSSSASSGSGTTITIKNFAFTVPTSVKAGATVTVQNNDTTAHTATANDKSFNTGHIEPGRSATITVSKAGAVKFHCDIHNYMTATLNVTS